MGERLEATWSLQQKNKTISERLWKRKYRRISGLDETGVSNCEIVERGFSPEGRPPVLPVETKRQRVNMLSAVSSQGKVRFMIYPDTIDAEHDIVHLKILDTAYSYLQRSIQAVRDPVAKARATVLGADDSSPPRLLPNRSRNRWRLTAGSWFRPLRQLPANRAGNAIISRSPMITWAWAAKNEIEGMTEKIKGHENHLERLEKELVNAREESERPSD